MRRSAGHGVRMVVAGCILAMCGAPAAWAAEAGGPALKTKFENGDSINDLLTALALRFNAIIVQTKPAKGFVLKNFELPERLDDAVILLRQNLEPQGFGVVESVNEGTVVLKIVAAKEAKAAALTDSPVTYGTATEKIDTSKPERLVTHLLPITHPDLIDKLKRTATEDPDVTAEVIGNNDVGLSLIFTGPAKKLQRAVEAVIKLDGTPADAIVARVIELKQLQESGVVNQDMMNQIQQLQQQVQNRTQQTRMSSLQAQLGASAEEWAVIAPRIQKVMDLTADLSAQNNRNARAQQLVPISAPAAGVAPAAGQPGAGSVARAFAELQAAVRDPNSSEPFLFSKLKAYRDARTAVKEQLEAATKDLLSLMTLRQEGVLITNAIVE